MRLPAYNMVHEPTEICLALRVQKVWDKEDACST